MSSYAPNTGGVTPMGTAGEPSLLFTTGAMTGSSFTKTLTNTTGLYLIITCIDVIAATPNEGDNLTISGPTSTNQFYGTQVGAGHSSAFYDSYRGMFLIGQGQTVTVVTASSGSVWFATGHGYASQFLDQYSMS